MARLFTSSSTVVNFLSDGALNITGPVSIAAWVKLNAASLVHTVLHKSRNNNRDMPYSLRFASEVSPQRPTFLRAGLGAAWPLQTCAVGIAAGSWHHLAVTASQGIGTVDIFFYIDGVLVDTKFLTGQVQVGLTTNDARIGNAQTGVTTNASLAHVSLYNVELGPREILQTRSRGWTSRGLVFYDPLWGGVEANRILSDSVSIDGTNYLSNIGVNWLTSAAGAQGGKAIISDKSAASARIAVSLRPAASGDAITLRGNGGSTTGSGITSAVLVKPTGTAATDILIAFMAVNGSNVLITPPSGWTLIQRVDSSATGATAVLYRALGNVASTTFDFDSGSSISVIGFIGGFISVDNTTSLDNASSGVSGTTNILTATPAATVTNRAMSIGIAAQNSIGAATLSNLWPIEGDLGGGRRAGDVIAATVTGGPPFVSKYGGLPLNTGAWAMGSAENTVTADFIVNLEYGAGLTADKTNNLEYLVPLEADKAANLEWLLALQSDKAVLLEYLIGLAADRSPLLEFLAGLPADKVVTLEYLTPLIDDNTAGLEWLTQLTDDNTILLEILGVPILEKDFITALEFKIVLQDDSAVGLENTVPLTSDKTSPLEFGVGLLTDKIITFEFKGAVFADKAAALEYLANIGRNQTLPLEYLVTLIKDGIVGLEIISATVARDFIAALEYKTAAFADKISNLEFKVPVAQNRIVIFEELVTARKDGIVNLEFAGPAINKDAVVNLEWLTSFINTGVEYIIFEKGKIQSAGEIADWALDAPGAIEEEVLPMDYVYKELVVTGEVGSPQQILYSNLGPSYNGNIPPTTFYRPVVEVLNFRQDRMVFITDITATDFKLAASDLGVGGAVKVDLLIREAG